MKSKKINSSFEDSFILFHPVKAYRIAKGDTLGLSVMIILLVATLFSVISKTVGIDKISVTLFITADVLWIIRLSSLITDKINQNK